MKWCILLLVLFSVSQGMAAGRTVLSFNDGWTFKKGPFTEDKVKFKEIFDREWDKVKIPHTWNARDMQQKYNQFYAGEAYYRKKFPVDAGLKEKRVFLRFEGVGQVMDLYLNGRYIGNHKGGYSACVFELSKALKYGQENELLVRVSNAASPEVIPVNHVLFGVYGGIYRPVWLVITDKLNIAVNDCASSGVYITQKDVSPQSARVNVRVKLENKELQPQKVLLENTIYDYSGKICLKKAQEIVVLPQGNQSFEQAFLLKKPHLWQGRKDPYLYKVVTRLKRDGQILDEIVQPLGIRKFEIVAGKGFYLNGEKYPMYGVCRHQDWWGLGSALTNEHHASDLAEIMGIGATTVRFAHYQQSDYIYSKCDSLGLIIWAEIPFVNRVSAQEGPNAKDQLRELIRQSFNHPSIYVWGLHNEVYSPEDYTAALTRELHDLAKTEDPDRYTVSVNGYGIMEHPVNLNADIQGMNRYFGWYEKKIQDIVPWIENLETKYPGMKFMLSEYGADANIAHQTEYLGESLNWGKPYYPETFQTKLHEYQWSVIAKHPYIVASYLWNMFDFGVPMSDRGGVPARNMKGLITIDRKVKKDAYYFYKANWSEEPVVHITQRRLKEREKQVTDVTVYSNVGEPELYLNGEKINGVKKGYTDIHYIFSGVKLRQGDNTLKTVVKKDGKVYEDSIDWHFTREMKAGEAESLNSDKEHVGF